MIALTGKALATEGKYTSKVRILTRVCFQRL